MVGPTLNVPRATRYEAGCLDRPSVGGTDGRMGMSPHVALRHDVGGWGVVKAMFGYDSEFFFQKNECM